MSEQAKQSAQAKQVGLSGKEVAQYLRLYSWLFWTTVGEAVEERGVMGSEGSEGEESHFSSYNRGTFTSYNPSEPEPEGNGVANAQAITRL